MTIAMSLLSGVGYGGVTYFQHLIPALARTDMQHTYHFFVHKDDPLQTSIRQKNIIFHPCRWNTRSTTRRFLWEQCIFPLTLRHLAIDVVFTAKNLNIFFAPCKTVIAIRNVEPFQYRTYTNYWKLNLLSWIKWQLTRLSVRKADRIVAVSEAVADLVRNRFIGAREKIAVVYNGNPVNRLPEHDASLSPQSYLLSASKFVAYANQLNLLKGYALLRKQRNDVPPLWFAGGVHDKTYFKKVQSFVKEAGIEDYVQFLLLVPHDRLLQLYRHAKAFLFPSTLESCPHTLIEAMACGVPIAASNTPPMPEICSDAALYFDPQSPEDIARTIARVLHNQSERERLSSRGIMRARDFTWDATAQELLKVFASAGPS